MKIRWARLAGEKEKKQTDEEEEEGEEPLRRRPIYGNAQAHQ